MPVDSDDQDPSSTVVTLDAAEAEPSDKPLVLSEQDEDSENLVTLLKGSKKGLDVIEAIGKQVMDCYEADLKSNESYREKVRNNWKLFTGDLPPKKFPFEGAANAHIPLMFENMTRIVNRCFSELFGDWTGVVTVLPNGPDDEVTAEMLTKHGNWQISEQIPDFYRQMMRAMMQFFIPGDVICKSYFNPDTNTNCHEVLTCDDVLIPYVTVSTRSDFGDVPHVIQILPLFRHQIQRYRGQWEYIDDVIKRKASVDDEPEHAFAEQAQRAAGIEADAEDKSSPYKLLVFEGWSDELPAFGKGEKRDRFIKATVDYTTRKVMHLAVHEEASWQEKRRFERQDQEAQTYEAAVAQHQQQTEQMDMQRQALQTDVEIAQMEGMPVDPMMVDAEMQKLNPELYPPPIPPQWFQGAEGDPVQPEPPKKEPIHSYTHGVCVEPIVGWLGIGFGQMQSDSNRAANVMFSQTIDSATLANAWSIVTAGKLEFERPFSLSPGAINVAKGVSSQTLKDSIMELRPGQANPQLFDATKYVVEFAQSSAQAPDVLSGEPGKSGETRGGIQSRIEQATTQLSVPTRSFARTVVKPLLLQNAKLNEMFMRDEEVVLVNNHMLGIAPEQLKMGRRMYQRDYNVVFAADLRFATRTQRVAEADEVVGMAVSEGPLQQNLAFIQKAYRKALEARGRYDMIPYLGPQLPPPQEPLGLQPPAPPMPGGMPAEGVPGQEPLPQEQGVPLNEPAPTG